jgi:hypothetical protein
VEIHGKVQWHWDIHVNGGVGSAGGMRNVSNQGLVAVGKSCKSPQGELIASVIGTRIELPKGGTRSAGKVKLSHQSVRKRQAQEQIEAGDYAGEQLLSPLSMALIFPNGDIFRKMG